MIKFLCVIFSGLLLAACATTPREVLSEQDKINIKASRILVNTTQREIVMKHNNWINSDYDEPYSPMDRGAIVYHSIAYNPDPGLLSALLTSGIQHFQASTAIKSIAPVRAAIEDFDFVSYFNGEVHKTVAKLPWLKVGKQEIKFNIKDSMLDNVIHANENVTLFIGVTYALNSTFKQLEVAAYVKLVQKPFDKQPIRTLYTNDFYFINRLPEANKDTNKNKEFWINNNGAMLKAKLRDAATLLSSMIAMDIGNNGPSLNVANSKLITLRAIDGSVFKGGLIKIQNGYYIVTVVTDRRQMMKGTLYAINSNAIIK